MHSLLRTFVLSLALALGWTVIAQADDHPYALGTVWEISYIQTKPGKFEDYMKFLATTYAKEMDVAKAKGLVTSYKILTVAEPRDNEPDLILMVEHPKFASFDTSLADQDEMAKQVFGTLPKSAQAATDRESVRTLRGGLVAQELKLITK
jgi:hypothetical protein